MNLFAKTFGKLRVNRLWGSSLTMSQHARFCPVPYRCSHPYAVPGYAKTTNTAESQGLLAAGKEKEKFDNAKGLFQ